MRFHAYKVKNDHRASKPTKDKSIWTVSEWIEIKIFAEAGVNEWRSINQAFLWGIHLDQEGKLQSIGIDLNQDLYFAKFRCDKNGEWHGYPVHPLDQDIPPERVLEDWRRSGIIDKTDKHRIQRGRFRK